MTEAVIDASASSFLQQGLQSLVGITMIVNFTALSFISFSECSLLVRNLSFSYLSEFVGLFSLGHSGARRKRLASLGGDARTHFVRL